MRQLALGNIGRRISWTLVTVLLLPLLLMGVGPRKAQAQITRLPAVAVLDFGVLPNVPAGGILGRQATDAVVVEMTRTGRFDVTPRGQLNQQIQDLGLTPPLDNIGIQKLGQALGVDFIATGDITNVSYTDNPRRARVTISLRLTDTVSGELANGAIQTGYSPPPPPGFTPDDDTLLNQAITNAAFNAVRTINNYTLPEATILMTRDRSEVRLNRGGRDGITEGLEMIVIRGNERVGRVRVTSVSATESIAAIVDPGKGIRPEDRARAIFDLPGYRVTDTGIVQVTPIGDVKQYTPQRKKGKSIIAVVLGIAAAVFVASLLFGRRSRTQGAGVTGVTAQAYADPSTPQPLSAAAARVQISWDTGVDIPIGNIVEFHVFRDDLIIAALPATQRSFVDTPFQTPNFDYRTIATNPVGTFDAIVVDTGGGTGGGGTGGGGTGGGGTGGGTGNTGNNADPSIPNTLQTFADIFAPPMPVGVPHTYRVSVLYTQVRVIPTNTGGGGGGGVGGGGGGVGGGGGGVGGGGGGVGGGGVGGGGGGVGGGGGGGGTGGGTGQNTEIRYRETPVLATSGLATPIVRPALIGPTTDQNLQRVRVSFNTVQGADQYIFEFASSPQFSDKMTFGPFYIPYAPGVTSQSEIFDLSSRFGSLRAGQRIYARVGARNSIDSPGPRRSVLPNGDNYIYSADPNGNFAPSFAPIQAPPPPP